MLLNLLTKKNENVEIFSAVVIEVFKASLLSYTVFLLIDMVANNYISNYFPLTPLLIVTLASGLIASLLPSHPHPKITRTPMSGYLLAAVFSLVASIVVYLTIQDLGTLAYVLSLLIGVVSFGVSYYLLMYSYENTHHD